MRISGIALAIVGLLAAAPSAARSGETTVLDARSLWRCRFIKGTELVRLKSGKLEHTTGYWTYVKKDGKRFRQVVKAAKVRRRPAPPGQTLRLPQPHRRPPHPAAHAGSAPGLRGRHRR